MARLHRDLDSPVYTARFREFRAIYRNKVKQHKRQLNDHRLCHCGNITRESWKIINGGKKTAGFFRKLDMRDQGGQVISGVNLADHFNNYFLSLSANAPGPDFDSVHVDNYPESLFLTPTTPSEVLNIIHRTSSRAAAGVDEVSGRVLGLVGECVAEPLSFIINRSFSDGRFPDSLKDSKCIPVFKNKGSKNDVTGYRSICIQSQFAKIFEYAYSTRLSYFLESRGLLSEVQNGFRKDKSTGSAMFECLRFVYDSLNGRDHALGLFYDLSRAFDIINHQLLFTKLESVGVRGVTLDWARSYLVGRRQTVVLDGVKSDTRPVALGVPQGSILGPLFFIVFMNDLSRSCMSAKKIILYADDTNIIMSHKSLEGLVADSNTASGEFAEWCKDNGLILNSDKTQIMRFLPKNVNPDSQPLIRVNGKSVQLASSVKFLGLIMDEKLTWEDHIESVCTRISKTCYNIRSLRGTVSLDVLRLLYFGMVQTVLQYGLIFWGNSSYMQRAFVAQKRVLRCMHGSHPRASCGPLFKLYGILPLPCLYILNVIMYVREREVSYPKVGDIHDYETRNRHNVYLHYSRLSVGQNCPTYIGKKCLNKMLTFIQDNGRHSFKHAIYNYLLERSFYSVDEFLQGHC